MKARILSSISSVLFFVFVFSFFSYAEGRSSLPYCESAKCYALYDSESESFLISKRLDEVIAPASTVKIMSGLIVCETLNKECNKTVTITNEMINGVSGKNMGLEVGKKIKINIGQGKHNL